MRHVLMFMLLISGLAACDTPVCHNVGQAWGPCLAGIEPCATTGYFCQLTEGGGICTPKTIPCEPSTCSAAIGTPALVDGACVVPCESSADCGGGTRCVESVCVWPLPDAPNSTSSASETDAPPMTSTQGTTTGALMTTSGGTTVVADPCSSPGQPCQVGDDLVFCGEGIACVQSPAHAQGFGYCTVQCSDDAPCANGMCVDGGCRLADYSFAPPAGCGG